MKKLITVIATISSLNLVAQYGIVSTGASIQNTNGSISNSIGQPAYKNAVGSNNSSCEGLQQPFILITGIEEHDAGSISFDVYPNPAQSTLTINSSDDQQEFILFDLYGRKVLMDSFRKSTNINVSLLPGGLYILQVKIGKEIITKKIALN